MNDFTADIAVDFDGTCVFHKYPEVGENAPHAVRVLKRLSAEGHRLVLWTRRDGEHLREAVLWFAKHGIPLQGANGNFPRQSWSDSPKACVDYFIDDRNLFSPVVRYPAGTCLDWKRCERELERIGLLTKKTEQ